MSGRVWNAYVLELIKALHRPATYVGPVLVALVVLCAPLARPLVRDGVSDYAFIAYAAPMALSLLGLLVLLVYCAGQIAGEVDAGTIRTVLVRPIRRHEFLIAKLLLGMTYAALLSTIAGGLSWALAFALGDLNGVTYGGEVIYTNSEMLTSYLMALGLGLLPQFVAVSYALMISALTRSVSAAIGMAIGIWLAVDILKHPLRIAPFVFSSYIETPWQVFTDRCNGVYASWSYETLIMTLPSVAYFLAFVTVAVVALSRRDLHA